MSEIHELFTDAQGKGFRIPPHLKRKYARFGEIIKKWDEEKVLKFLMNYREQTRRLP